MFSNLKTYKKVTAIKAWIELKTSQNIIKYFINMPIPFYCLLVKYDFISFGLMTSEVNNNCKY